MRWSVAAMVVLAGLAGCSGPPPDIEEGDVPPEPLPLPRYSAATQVAAGLACQASSVGTTTTDNVRLLANVTVAAREIDVRDELALTTGGLVSIADPLRPQLLMDFTELDMPDAADVKFMPDNQSMVLGIILGGAVHLYDLRDPLAPVLEDEWRFSESTGTALPAGHEGHMLFTAHIAGQDWVFVAPTGSDGVWILRVDGTIGERTMTYVSQTLPVQGGALGPHDMHVGRDPFTDDWYLYSADGFAGWAVFNVNNPAAPQLVGGLVRPEAGYTHTVQAARLGERRIVATIQEIGANTLEVYDATDLRAPVLLATWRLATSGSPEAGPTAAQHNINIVNGTLYMAHYSHGLFIFDLADVGGLPLAGTATLAPVARYDPEPGGLAMPIPVVTQQFVGNHDIVVQGGLLFASMRDGPSVGVHVLAYGCNAIGDPALTSTG